VSGKIKKKTKGDAGGEEEHTNGVSPRSNQQNKKYYEKSGEQRHRKGNAGKDKQL